MSTAYNKLIAELKNSGLLLGGIAAALLVFLFASGTLLAFFYDSAPERAYESVRAMADGTFTSLLRNFHYWSSDLLLFVLFLHITRVALTKPSGAPRRYAWWIGVGLLLLVGIEMLVGRFLRADQEAVEAFTHFVLGTTGILATYVPAVTWFTEVLSGHTALFRLLIIHIAIIPFLITLCLMLHGFFAPTFRVLATPVKQVWGSAERGTFGLSAFTAHPRVRKLLWITLATFGVVELLAMTLPAPLYGPPYGGVEITTPPWWLMWIVAGENVWGLEALLLFPPILFVVYALIPLWTKERRGVDAGIAVYLVTLAIVTLLGYYAAFAKPVAHTEHFIKDRGTGAETSHELYNHH